MKHRRYSRVCPYTVHHNAYIVSCLTLHNSIVDQSDSLHYNDAIMSSIASRITSFTIVDSSVYSVTAQRKHQSSASLAFVRGIHRWPVNSPQKRASNAENVPFDDVIMASPALVCLVLMWIALWIQQLLRGNNKTYIQFLRFFYRRWYLQLSV